MERYHALSRIFKTLMHPGRLAILEALRAGEQCVCHLEAVLGRRQAYISQHLAVLREAGLVEDRRDGWNIFYRVTKPEVFYLVDQASRLLPDLVMPGHPAPPVSPMSVCQCPRCTSQLERPLVENLEAGNH